jgi:hypothetical protein
MLNKNKYIIASATKTQDTGIRTTYNEVLYDLKQKKMSHKTKINDGCL